MARECSIVDSILKYLNGLPYCIAEKVVGNSNQKGRPDINCCYKGLCIRIEVKTEDHGNKASKMQELNIAKWRNAGAICIVAYSVLDVEKLIDKINEERR